MKNTKFDDILRNLSDEEISALYSGIYADSLKYHIDEESMQEELLDNSRTIIRKLSEIPVLGQAVETADLFCRMLRDSVKKEYVLSPSVKTAVIGALLYLAIPVDIIPDGMPLVGYLDDARVLEAVLCSVRGEIAGYKIYLQQKQCKEFMESVEKEAMKRFCGCGEDDPDNIVSFNKEGVR